MINSPIVLTGFGSVSAFGPHRGLLAPASVDLQVISRWPTRGARRARLVPRFRASDVVPGLKTRRMDRLSVWALVAASLALEDARFEPESSGDHDRTAVILGTAFGCLDMTEEFLLSITRHGPAMADPILFPETLSNLPAGHVARHFGLRGPNVTLSCGGLSAEAALGEAMAQMLCGETDVAVVMAGDLLSRALFEWYEAASLLAPECFEVPGRHARRNAFVPGEGLGVVVIETADGAAARGVTPYAQIHSLRLEHVSESRSGDADPGDAADWFRRVTLSGIDPARVRLVAAMRDQAGGAGPRQHSLERFVSPASFGTCTVSGYTGEFWSGGLVGLALALGHASSGTSGFVLAVSTDPGGARSTLALWFDEGSRR